MEESTDAMVHSSAPRENWYCMFRMTVFQGLAMDHGPMDYRLTVSTLSTSLGTTSY